MNLDAVVAVDVGVFGIHALGERSAGRCQLVVQLQFSLFFIGELAGAFDIFKRLVDVDIASCLVKEGAASVQASLHVGKHFVDAGEVDDSLVELLTVLGVGESFVVGSLADTHCLCSDTETGSVHEGHHVLDETELATAAEFCLSVLVNQFAGRRTVDTHLVFNTTNIDATVALVVDEHRKTAAILGAFFRAGKNQVNVGVTVGDEALHAVQVPALVCFAVGCLQHHALQVGTGIGFGQVHGHGFAGADAGHETGTLIFVAEFVQSFDTVLKGPDVFETCVAGSDHFVNGGVSSYGEVQATETTGHGNAAKACLHGCFQVFVSLACVADAAVFAMRTFCINCFCVGCDHVGNDVASQFANLVVVVDCVGVVGRSVIGLFFISKAIFPEFHNAVHQGAAFEIELNLWMICIEICHSAYLLFAL
ncbi:hypothetical protein MMG03_002492 [Fibrobacter succinogenes]|nr:hypothetical protein [Fibrobacter succinogenes]